MKQVQRGFTLIELVMVIVILGVLAAVAIPKFVDLKTDAEKAAVDGIAGALASASAINYAAKKLGKSTAITVTACADLASLLQGGLPSTVTLGGTLAACTVTSKTDSTAVATFVPTAD